MGAVDVIKERITKEKVEELLLNSGATNLTQVGDSFRCGCPLHGGHNPTGFKWDLKDNVWICHSGDCGGGDLFSFVAYVNDLSVDHDFRRVVELTAEFLGIDLSTLALDEIRTELDKERKKWILYMKNKLNKQVNKEYDIRNLGQLFKLNNYLSFDKEFLDKHGIFYAKDYNRIAFTIKDSEGKVIGASLRRVNEQDKIKWLHRPKSILTGHVLYNLNNISECDTCYVVEGIKDALKLVQLGVNNVVATFGTNITQEQVLLLSRFFNLVVMYDNDNAGKKGTLKAISSLRHIFNLKVIDLADIGVNDPYEIDSLDTFSSIKQYKPHQYLEKYNLDFKDLK